MRIGLFGGSFDPIHAGHVEPVERARRELALDRVVYLPTAVPPHKRDRRFAPALARFTMAELALLDWPDLVVSDYELTLGRPAYTVETVAHFQRVEAQHEIVLLLGADSFCELASWVRWREIVAAVQLGVLVRPGWTADPLDRELAPELAEAIESGRVHFVANPPHPASSTEIRRRLAAGEEIPAGWLAEPVLRYLAKYRLYR